MMDLCLSLLFLLSVQLIKGTEVLRPRGVPLHKVSFYNPGRDFTCLDGSDTISFINVNDDYCDCKDGSDEPGTSACPTARFHCPNVGYKEKEIVSGWVNDGICDCCDGSDEYNSTAKCVNNCMAMGEAWRAEIKRQEELRKQGYALREQYVAEAASKRNDSELKLKQFRKELEELEPIKNEKEALKKAAEEKEHIATEAFKKKEEDKKKVLSEEDLAKAQKEDLAMAESAFLDLDVNDDETLHYTELQTHLMFDQDKDGVVSDEEAKFFLHMKDQMDMNEFTTTGWVIMKPYYLRHKETTSPSTEAPKPEWEDHIPEPDEFTDSPESLEHDEELAPSDESQAEREEVDDEEEAPQRPPRFHHKKKADETVKDKEETPQYDEETQRLIELAKRAREEYSEVENKYTDIQNQIRELEVFLSTDYGSEAEFMVLQGQCFDLQDHQYLYKFCPFDRASQKEETSSEVNLGKWGKWNGPESNKYQVMRLDGGAGCWNGPSRSVDVHMRCGVSNALLSASEPNRCEYRFEFQTPAMCVGEPHASAHEHTEL